MAEEKEMVAIIEKGATPKFSKAQLSASYKYMNRRDALTALLKDDEKYSFAQVDAILKKFDEGVKK